MTAADFKINFDRYFKSQLLHTPSKERHTRLITKKIIDDKKIPTHTPKTYKNDKEKKSFSSIVTKENFVFGFKSSHEMTTHTRKLLLLYSTANLTHTNV
jgi:hypothetical protein